MKLNIKPTEPLPPETKWTLFGRKKIPESDQKRIEREKNSPMPWQEEKPNQPKELAVIPEVEIITKDESESLKSAEAVPVDTLPEIQTFPEIPEVKLVDRVVKESHKDENPFYQPQNSSISEGFVDDIIKLQKPLYSFSLFNPVNLILFLAVVFFAGSLFVFYQGENYNIPYFSTSSSSSSSSSSSQPVALISGQDPDTTFVVSKLSFYQTEDTSKLPLIEVRNFTPAQSIAISLDYEQAPADYLVKLVLTGSGETGEVFNFDLAFREGNGQKVFLVPRTKFVELPVGTYTLKLINKSNTEFLVGTFKVSS